jgi:hypothetical protein
VRPLWPGYSEARTGQRFCSSRHRWAAWDAAGRPTQAREPRDGLLLIRAQVDDLLASVERRR